MAFIEKLIGPDEKLIGIARLHWIYGIKGLAWLAGFMVLGGMINWGLMFLLGGIATRTALGGFLTLGNAVFWICLALGICLFVFYFIMMLATEIGLTTTRLLYKKGLIFVNSEGIDLEEIKGAHVDNEVLGRILNYGTIRFDARFINDLILPAVADPYRFVKALNDQRSQMKEDSMRIVLDEKGPRVTAALEKTMKDAMDPPSENDEPPPQLEDPRYEALEFETPLGVIGEISGEALETAKAIEGQVGGKEAIKAVEKVAPKAAELAKPAAKPESESESKSESKPAPEPEDKKTAESDTAPEGGEAPETSQNGPILISALKDDILSEFESNSRH